MPEERAGMPPWPSRRSVLTVGLAAVASVSLSACGIRLEDDAPRVPLIPTRKPIAGESFLLSLWQHCDDLAEQAAALGGAATALPARLASLHRSQAAVLESELLRLGVPQGDFDEARTAATALSSASTTAGSPSATATGPSTAAPPHTGPKGLAAAEAGDLGPSAITSLAGVPATATPLVGSLLAQRAAAAALLGAPAPWPDATWSGPSLAASYLVTTRSAVYAFEVVTAQSPKGAQRTLAAATLASLEARAETQESLAGASAEPPALAYPLPKPVTTPGAARQLAVRVLTDLRAAVAGDLASTGGETGPLGSVVQWLAETEVLASRWGVALSPFPGLK
jgi:hypothetical protein